MKRYLLAIFLAADATFLASYAVAFLRSEAAEAAPANTEQAAQNPSAAEQKSPGPAGNESSTASGEGRSTENSAANVIGAGEGKETLDAKDSKDAKEILPIAEGKDAKEIPPIGEFTEAVKTGYLPVSPGTEYLSRTERSSRKSSRIFLAPNPPNVRPPVVSPEVP